jgi:hypothetical protein
MNEKALQDCFGSLYSPRKDEDTPKTSLRLRETKQETILYHVRFQLVSRKLVAEASLRNAGKLLQIK